MKATTSKKLNDFKKVEIKKNLNKIKGGNIGTDEIVEIQTGSREGGAITVAAPPFPLTKFSARPVQQFEPPLQFAATWRETYLLPFSVVQVVLQSGSDCGTLLIESALSCYCAVCICQKHQDEPTTYLRHLFLSNNNHNRPQARGTGSASLWVCWRKLSCSNS
eukprot:TRINITY_DN38768_c0_g1_i1.p3 TRINITY_DN38768_c0_g1~~TRINITY_DN38768_c0_g1_i1.p3  ORF type:complete len:163 (-),score=8.35 TRINITY_DN38768_c0_g1_i1:248-736(-)